MFTGNSDHNQLPHSSVVARTSRIREAGNYQERAVGLGADDYHLWYRLFKIGAKFVRDDAVRNVVYRIHEKNSLKIRRARYGAPGAGAKGVLIAGATAASMAIAPLSFGHPADPNATLGKKEQKIVSATEKQDGPIIDPPHS